jgi:hypothetical protein
MCDRAKMYWSLGCLQWCWAHLKRDFQALIDSHDQQVKRLGHDLMRPTRKLFAAWARYRDGTITRAGMKRVMKPIRAEIEGLLLRGAFSGNERLLGMCNELYDHRQWLWTFLDHEGVEPTNNRGLHHDPQPCPRPLPRPNRSSVGTDPAQRTRRLPVSERFLRCPSHSCLLPAPSSPTFATYDHRLRRITTAQPSKCRGDADTKSPIAPAP